MGDPASPHLDADTLVEAIEGTAAAKRSRWIRHLSECCEPCWRVLRSGMAVRILARLPDPDDTTPAPGPTAFALCRLLAYHAPESPGRTRADVLRPLYARHRDALRKAHEVPGGFLRLLLDECQLERPFEIYGPVLTSPLALVRSVVELIPSATEGHADPYEDLRAWGQAGLARAAHLQGAAGDRVRAYVEQAVSHAERGTRDPLLAATLLELRSLPADEGPGIRIAFVDQALAMIEGDLEAELLLAKARRLAWQPEEVSRLCRRALELLGSDSPPRLRVGVLDRLAAAELDLGHAEEARSSWLEAQRFSDLAGEEPVHYCRRWEELARTARTDGSLAEATAASRAAIWGYRTLRFQDDAARLIVDLRRALGQSSWPT